ncbi:MAG: tetratricopeptide repeat protein [Desulfobacterales bacterium]|nr:tetratricopeptide repeat protein [Desulfobacterales bacterium]
MSKAKKKFDAAMTQFASQSFDKSIDLFNEAIAVDPEFKMAIKSRGAAYMRLGNIPDALADFNRVIELDPQNAQAYHLRGLAYEKAGEYTEALTDLSKAIEINPEYGAAYYSRANLYAKIGDTDQAAEDAAMVTQLTEVNIETFGGENNIWRSRQLQLETVSNHNLTMKR